MTLGFRKKVRENETEICLKVTLRLKTITIIVWSFLDNFFVKLQYLEVKH